MDAADEARAFGFEYPVTEDDAVDEALAAVSRLQEIVETPPVAEEELLVHEWNEDWEEDEEDSLN